MRIRALFTPNQVVSKTSQRAIWLGWMATGVLFWQFWPSDILPRPLDVWAAFADMWANDGLGQQLITSYGVQLKALAIASIVSLVLAYSASIAVMRPLVVFISALRFISLGPLVIFFSLLVSSDAQVLKTSLLVFAISVFYITTMLPVVLDVPTEELDHTRTLKMNEWHAAWEVIVLGRLDVALDMLRQNAAMGWMMLTMVEGLVRSEGGIGTLLLNQLKHFKLAEVAAIIVVLFAVGFAQDLALEWLRRLLFPYSELEKTRR